MHSCSSSTSFLYQGGGNDETQVSAINDGNVCQTSAAGNQLTGCRSPSSYFISTLPRTKIIACSQLAEAVTRIVKTIAVCGDVCDANHLHESTISARLKPQAT